MLDDKGISRPRRFEGLDPPVAQLGVAAALSAAVLTFMGQAVYSSIGAVPVASADLLSALDAHQIARIAYAGALAGSAAVAMLFLWPVLFRVLRDGSPHWSFVGLLLATTGSALVIIGFGATQWVVPLSRAVRDGGLDLKVAGAIGDAFTGVSAGIVEASFVVLGAGFAAFSVALLRTQIFPRVFGWLAAVLSIILVMQVILPKAASLYEIVAVAWFLWLAAIMYVEAVPSREAKKSVARRVA